jgi:microcystin-dependent protein
MNKSFHIASVLSLTLTSIIPFNSAEAQEPYLGDITFFAGNFAPRGWANCDGQLMPISQNQALFSLLGTQYGGDGRTTFALPDMRSRVAVGEGSGPDGLNFRIGQSGGVERVNLTAANLPPHTHSFSASTDNSTSTVPTSKALASNDIYASDSSGDLVSLNQATLGNAGGSQSINNMQPSLVGRCIIAIQGVFPSRN